jgi:hypothetical protein
VVEGAVLLHQHHDVLDVRDGRAGQACAARRRRRGAGDAAPKSSLSRPRG